MSIIKNVGDVLKRVITKNIEIVDKLNSHTTSIALKHNTSDFNTFKTANTSEIAKKADKTDTYSKKDVDDKLALKQNNKVGVLTTTSKYIAGAINEIDANKANLSLSNVNLSAQQKEMILGVGIDGKINLLPKSAEITSVQTIVIPHPISGSTWVPAGETSDDLLPRIMSVSARYGSVSAAAVLNYVNHNIFGNDGANTGCLQLNGDKIIIYDSLDWRDLTITYLSSKSANSTTTPDTTTTTPIQTPDTTTTPPGGTIHFGDGD